MLTGFGKVSKDTVSSAAAGVALDPWPHDHDGPPNSRPAATVVASTILTATPFVNILFFMISIFSPIRLLIVLACAALAPALPGCPPAAKTGLNAAANSHESAADVLRLRTDSLLHAIVLFKNDEIKNFFPPGADVDVIRQLDLYLKAPYPRTRVLSWNAENVFVQISPDGRFARTATRLEFLASDPKAKPLPQEITFEWQADEKGAVFYLVPLKLAP